MFAIICTGNKQFKVSSGDLIRVPYLDGKKPKTIVKMKVLALQEGSDFFSGSADIKTASVKAVILGQGRGSKTLVFKKKRRKGYRRTKGHRQAFTSLRITEIKKSAARMESVKKTNTTEPRKGIKRTAKSAGTESIKQAARKKSPIRKAQLKTSAKQNSKGKGHNNKRGGE